MPGEEVSFGGNDVLDGGPGGDRIWSGLGNDTVRGGADHDFVLDFSTTPGSSGSDTYDGGEGADWLSYDRRRGPVAVRLDGARNDGADPDRSGASATTEEVDQDLEIENVRGGAAADRLVGNAFVNVLAGLGGDDRLVARDGTSRVDQILCGPGADDRFRKDAADAVPGCEGAF